MQVGRRFIRSRVGMVVAASIVTSVMIACATGTDSTDPGSDLVVVDGATTGNDGTVLHPQDSSVLPTDASTGDVADTSTADSSPVLGNHVVINELQTGTSASADAEFVELYNPTASDVSLSGWQVRYESSGGNPGPAGHAFVTGDSIPAKGFLLLSTGNGKWTSGLAGAGGQIGLFNTTGTGGTLIDGVAYGSISGGLYGKGTSALSPPADSSIGRKPDGVDTGSNGADFATYTTPTPGAANL